MSELYIGLMSGTSLDGVDAVLVDFAHARIQVLAEHFVAYPQALRQDILALQTVASNELDREARLANQLADIYAQAVLQLLAQSPYTAANIQAVCCHGQTIRHAPEHGYTWQCGNLAQLAEACGIDVIGDLRSRDIAAGGQGAPLVPAFHRQVFHSTEQNRLIINIGGIANLTYLGADGEIHGFDSGPGNMLMDAWIMQHCGQPFDRHGLWAASGQIHQPLLHSMLQTGYFQQTPPKSTGRDLFDLAWLQRMLAQHTAPLAPADVQATLAELVAISIIHAAQDFLPPANSAYLCGGGAHNHYLQQRLAQHAPHISWHSTAELGLPVHQVEATAFAWLGYCFSHRKTANLPIVTGAKGHRILGALYPA